MRWQDDRNFRDSRLSSRRKDLHHTCSKSTTSDRVRSRANSNNAINSREQCLGVFGLSSSTTESDLRRIFSRYGLIERVTIIRNFNTGISRCYGFVYFCRSCDARYAKDKCDGMLFDRRTLRVDFSNTYRSLDRESERRRGDVNDRWVESISFKTANIGFVFIILGTIRINKGASRRTFVYFIIITSTFF